MIEEARKLAERLRLGYGYSPSLNMAAAKCLDELAVRFRTGSAPKRGCRNMASKYYL